MLDQRLEVLGDLAIRTNWDSDRERTYGQRMEELRRLKSEVVSPWRVTAGILAQDPPRPPPGTRVIAVPAYQSLEGLSSDFVVEELAAEPDRSTLGLLLGHLLAVPDDIDPDAALRKAVDLATRNDSFREHRRRLYAWQDDVIRQGTPPVDAAEEMAQMIKAYNRCVEKAVRKVYYKFAFTVAGIALTGAVLSNPWVAAGAALKIVQFATLDRKPVVNAGENEAAAMFHDVETAFGSRLRFA